MKLLSLSDVPETIAHDLLKRHRFIAPGEVQSKLQTVNYAVLEEGESYTPHAHPDCEEYVFVIAGAAGAEIAGKKITLQQGDFLVIEKDEMHVFMNNSKQKFEYLQFRILL